jgi:hypothetical protein
MTGPYRALPLLLNMCAAIDNLFIEEVGPFGQLLCAEARTRWLASGNKMKTTDLDPYIVMLAAEIDGPERKSTFQLRARAIVGTR